MNFREIASRLTGFSVPIFGISWNPEESERSIARRIITMLEDKRVLYNPSHLEIAEHCVQSVIEIRRDLTHELSGLEQRSVLGAHLRGMRAACRKLMDVIQAGDRIARFGMDQGHHASWVFLSAVGELRGIFGMHLAALASEYGLEVERELASILPIGDDDRDVE